MNGACRKSFVKGGSRVHSAIFTTLARHGCRKACKAHLKQADESLDEAVKGHKAGDCRLSRRLLAQAWRHVRQARKAKG